MLITNQLESGIKDKLYDMKIKRMALIGVTLHTANTVLGHMVNCSYLLVIECMYSQIRKTIKKPITR